jgi:hypothetical protein
MCAFKHSILVKDGYYNSFPSIVRAADGALVMVYRQAQNSLKAYGAITHVDVTSRVMMKTSRDEGLSWSDPRVIYDDEMGEQDPCLTCLSDGTLICTFFRWRVVPKEDKALLGEAFNYFGRIIFDRWAAVHVGTVCIRSFDHGATWDGPWHFLCPEYQGPLALRGNIVELPDGRILAPLYGVKHFGELARCPVMVSSDNGATWHLIGETPVLDGHNFLEPFLYKSPSGRLDILMRTQLDFRKLPFDETYRNLHVSSSFDGGLTWDVPRETALFCPNPVHVLALGDGRVCVTYGQRRDPKGIEGLFTDDGQPVFSDADKFSIRPSDSGDLGYTSAVMLKDGRILVVYYMTDAVDGDTCIGATVMEATV